MLRVRRGQSRKSLRVKIGMIVDEERTINERKGAIRLQNWHLIGAVFVTALCHMAVALEPMGNFFRWPPLNVYAKLENSKKYVGEKITGSAEI